MTAKARYSPHQLAYFAHQLTLRAASDSMDSMASALLVQKLKVQALGASEEHMLMAAVDSAGSIYDQDIAEKLLNIPAKSIALPRQQGLPEQAALPKNWRFKRNSGIWKAIGIASAGCCSKGRMKSKPAGII